jgi:hypothetical protein
MKIMELYPEDCIQSRKGDVVLVKYPPSKKNDPAYAKFRSAVFCNGVLVGASPSKSVSYTYFRNTYPIESCVLEEFVEGTMINVWYGNNTWNIATRSVIDATCTFESDKTFSEMFYECMTNDPLELDTAYCYSVVMQHPENKIVTPVDAMKLYIVGQYQIVNGVAVECPDVSHSPTRYTVASYEEAEALAQTVGGKGLMLKCNGERSKIKRTQYYDLEHRKGNESFLYTYLSVRNRNPDVTLFFADFPWYVSEGVQIETQVNQLIQTLYTSYVSYYIRKQQMPPHFPYKKSLCEIHAIYRQFRLRITQANVHAYVNQLHPRQLTYLLRSERTARIVPSPPDTIG